MTYRELIETLQSLPQERLEDDVSIYVSDFDEYYPLGQLSVAHDFSDILDPGHIYLETAVAEQD